MKNNSARSGRGALWRAPVMAALTGAALLAACSGGSHASAPGTGAVTAQEVDAYMQCMRSHGMTNFYLSRPPGIAGEDPSTTLGLEPYGVVLGVNFSSPQFESANSACQHFLPGSAPPPLTATQLRSLDRAAACMRSHGFPDWPDPDVQNGQLVPNPLPASIDTSSPQFLAALKTCHPGNA